MSAPLALVTGAPGWLGTRLVELLVAAGREVRVLVHGGAGARDLSELPRGIEQVEGDVSDPRAVARFLAGASGAALFHSAGVIHPRRVIDFYRVNTVGTRLLVAGAEAVGIGRMVHVSSNSPLGMNPVREQLFDESVPYNPYRNYGRSKMLAEEAVRGARSLDWVIVRPPWFYGPGQPARQTRFFTMIKQGRAPIVGDGENLRSMGYIDNLCQGVLLAERVAAASRQIYWIADRRPYSMNEVVATVARVMARDFGIPVRPGRLRLPGLASTVAGLCDAAIQGLGRYNQELHVLSEMNQDIACSIAKAERELGYAPEVELEEGMRRSLAWMQERGIRP